MSRDAGRPTRARRLDVRPAAHCALRIRSESAVETMVNVYLDETFKEEGATLHTRRSVVWGGRAVDLSCRLMPSSTEEMVRWGEERGPSPMGKLACPDAIFREQYLLEFWDATYLQYLRSKLRYL